MSSPNLPVADRRGGALGDVAWGLAITVPIVVAAALFSALLIQGTGAVPESPLPPSINSSALLFNLMSAAIIAPVAWAAAVWAGLLPVRAPQKTQIDAE